MGNNIKELRKQNHMTQADLSKKMHVSQQTIGAWETERAIPGSDTLKELADLFNVSTDYLLGRHEKHTTKEMTLDEAVDSVMSFEGRTVTDHDRQMMKSLWKSYLENKE